MSVAAVRCACFLYDPSRNLGVLGHSVVRSACACVEKLPEGNAVEGTLLKPVLRAVLDADIARLARGTDQSGMIDG